MNRNKMMDDIDLSVFMIGMRLERYEEILRDLLELDGWFVSAQLDFFSPDGVVSRRVWELVEACDEYIWNLHAVINSLNARYAALKAGGDIEGWEEHQKWLAELVKSSEDKLHDLTASLKDDPDITSLLEASRFIGDCM